MQNAQGQANKVAVAVVEQWQWVSTGGQTWVVDGGRGGSG